MKKTPKSSWTIQTAFTEDIAVAGKLARRVGVPHIVIPAASGLSAELERNALTNFCSLQHTWMLAARQAVREAANAYDGIGGDVLSESSIVTGEMVEMFERGKLDAFAERLVPDRPLPPFARTALFPDRNDAIERVLNEASRHLAAVNPASSFFFWNRTRRDIAESAFTLLASTGATVHAPFLDDDLFAFLASLPPNQTVGTHLHTASISRAFPDFQDIPYAGKQIVEPSYPSRTAILAAMTRLARARGHIIDKPALFVRLFFSLLTPAYGKKSGWIIPMGAYLAQISNPQRIF